MAGKSPQPSYEPPFQAEGTLRADASQIGEGKKGSGLGEALAPNYQSPEAPYKKQLGKEKDTQEIPVKWEGLLPPR